MNGPIMRNKHQGALNELTAATWLLSQGFEVFRNVSQHGAADIVIWDQGKNEFVAIDVKSVWWSEFAKADGTTAVYYLYNKVPVGSVRPLYVYPDGEISWEKRPNFIKPPDGYGAVRKLPGETRKKA